MLLRNGANDSAMVLSSRYGNIDVVKFLVNGGANTHAQNGCSLTEETKHKFNDARDFLASVDAE